MMVELTVGTIVVFAAVALLGAVWQWRACRRVVAAHLSQRDSGAFVAEWKWHTCRRVAVAYYTIGK